MVVSHAGAVPWRGPVSRIIQRERIIPNGSFYWLEKSRDASPPPAHAQLAEEPSHPMSSSKFSASSIPFSSSAMFSGLASHMPMSMSLSSSFSNSPTNHFSPNGGHSASPASLLFAHHNGHHSHHSNYALAQTPPTPSLLSAFSANTLLSPRRLRLIASMFAQMCEAVAVCHEAGVSHRDIKPENFICCDSVELETVQEGDDLDGGFGPQAKRKVVVKLTDFGLATTEEESGDVECGSRPYMSYGQSWLVRDVRILIARVPQQSRSHLLPSPSRCLVPRYRPDQYALPPQPVERPVSR